jgi:hypothetical protein
MALDTLCVLNNVEEVLRKPPNLLPRYIRRRSVRKETSLNLYERNRMRRRREQYENEAYELAVMCDMAPTEAVLRRAAEKVSNASKYGLQQFRHYPEQVNRVRPYLDQRIIGLISRTI